MPSKVTEKHTKNLPIELVSIITPCYNAQDFLAETIASVQRQSYPHWEMIIVDDASTDHSRELLQAQAAKEPRITVHLLKTNSGAAVARNKAIELAKGKYLAFLDADDVWLPFHLEKSIQTIQSKNIPFVFASCKRVNENNERIYTDFIVPQQVNYSDILKTNSIPCLTVVLDIHHLGKEKMPLIKKRQDMGLWLKYLKNIPYAYGHQECHAIYRIRKDSLSRNKIQLIGYQWEFYRKVENLSVFQSIYYLLCWMYFGYRKYK